MEFPELGQNCAFETCSQLDFLPIKCEYCSKIFCNKHNLQDKHKCSNQLMHFENKKENITISLYPCNFGNCKKKELTPVTCSHCSICFCLQHRHQVDHNCVAYKPPSNPMEEAAAKIKKLTEELTSESKVRKVKKNDKLAAKVQLMKLKGKAIGNKELPIEERIYFSVSLPASYSSAVEFPIFVSHYWTVGRAIDAIADLAKVTNKNNESSAHQLRLVRPDNGFVIQPLDVPLKNLVENEEIQNGQSISLEYVPK